MRIVRYRKNAVAFSSASDASKAILAFRGEYQKHYPFAEIRKYRNEGYFVKLSETGWIALGDETQLETSR